MKNRRTTACANGTIGFSPMSDCIASTEFTIRKVEPSSNRDRRFRPPCLRCALRFRRPGFSARPPYLQGNSPMSLLPIRYVAFDCYGTLVDFRVGDVARDRLADRVPPDRMAAFLEDFTAYRFDEVLGAWKPYPEVLHRSLERTCRRWGVAFDPADAQAIVEAVPTWGPHADVPATLAKVAEILPFVIL